MKFFKWIKNEKGVSLIQILIASGLMSIVSLGIVRMIESSRINQRRIVLVQNLAEQKRRMENLMRDQNAFSQTILGNTGAPWTDIKSGVSVTEMVSSTVPRMFALYDATGDSAKSYDFQLGPSMTAGGPYNGLTEKLTPCTNFYPPGSASANDQCPISYRLMVTADCAQPGYTQCYEPSLKLVGRLVFSPSPTGTLSRFRTQFDQIAGFSLDSSQRDGKYDAVVMRTPSSISRGFKIAATVPKTTTPNGSCSATACTAACNAGGGTCNDLVGTWSLHPKTSTGTGGTGYSVISDPFSLLKTTNLASGQFGFKEEGTYSCSVTGWAFGTQSLLLQLVNATASTALGYSDTFAAPRRVVDIYTTTAAGESQARLDLTFYVSAANLAQYYEVRQYCTVNTESACSLGYAKGNTALTEDYPILTVTCNKMDNAF